MIAIVLRVTQAVFVLLAAYTVTFCVLRLVPGDPVTVMLTAGGHEVSNADPEQVAVLTAKFGLDKPPLEQYFAQLWDLVRGDFGFSYRTGNPVIDVITDRAPSTLSLSALALVLAVIGGLALACVTALTNWQPLRRLLRRLPALGIAVPSFLGGLLLIQVFAFSLGLLPSGGGRGFSSLILPALTLAIPAAAVIAQVLMKGFDEVAVEPYLNTARMKGLSRVRVLLRHGLPNAIAPTVTMLALIIGSMVTGTVVVEELFSRNGLGKELQQAVLHHDFPVVQGIVVLASVLFVTINLLVDLLYPLLDPRQRDDAEVPEEMLVS
ncbi:MAG: ABC transporter permease [Gulosibacter sp.]|uniref:ABC transporter permease n=1 Tax=Gulosibacter sp. TaxID=2817531 RepID=UPI003F907979